MSAIPPFPDVEVGGGGHVPLVPSPPVPYAYATYIYTVHCSCGHVALKLTKAFAVQLHRSYSVLYIVEDLPKDQIRSRKLMVLRLIIMCYSLEWFI